MNQLRLDIKKIIQRKLPIIAASLFGAAIFFYSCNNDIEEIKAFSSPEELPVVTAFNFETSFIDSGKVNFFLKAPKLLRFEVDGQPHVEFPKGILLKKFDKSEKVISVITAEYARQNVNEKKWDAKDNVVVVNAQNDTLKTEHLIWDEKKGKIYSEMFVRIIREDQIINGIGFESDQNMNNWRIKNPTGIIYVEVKKNDGNPANDIIQGSPQNFQEQKPIQFQK